MGWIVTVSVGVGVIGERGREEGRGWGNKRVWEARGTLL